MYFELALFFATGLLSGLIGGLLGIGGGVITVPILYYFFIYSGQYSDEWMQWAVSTSLAVAFITSGISTYHQWRKKAIQREILKWMVPTLFIGCIFGAFIAHHMESRILSSIFAILALLMGIYFFFPKLPKLKIASKPNSTLSLAGLFIGILSSMLGLGGGSIAFPILLGYQVPIRNASATSSASTFISTGLGTVGYLLFAWSSHGYIDFSAWVLMSVGSIFTAGLGVKLSHRLEIGMIKRIFGFFLILIALSMLFN